MNIHRWIIPYLLATFLLGLSCGHSVLKIYQEKSLTLENERRTQVYHLDLFFQKIKPILELNNDDSLFQWIKAYKDVGYFDAFALYKSQNLLQAFPNNLNLNLTTFTPHLNLTIETDSYQFEKIEAGNYQLLAGFKRSPEFQPNLNQWIELVKQSHWHLYLFLISLFSWPLLKIVLDVMHSFNKKSQEFREFKIENSEDEAMQLLFLHAESLKNIELTKEIPEGSEIELRRNTRDREEFFGGIFRIRLNNYDELCAKHSKNIVDVMCSPLHREFKEMSQRYFYYPVFQTSHELAFYCHSDNKAETLKAGISAIRDIYHIVGELTQKMRDNFNIHLDYRSSLIYDRLLFIKEEGKNKIKGTAFVQAGKVMDVFQKDVKLKDWHLVVRTEDYYFVGDFALGKLDLKEDIEGVGKWDLALIRKFRPWTAGNEFIKYYKSNRTIAEIFYSLSLHPNETLFWTLFNNIKTFKVFKRLNDFEQEAFLGLLRSLEKSASDKMLAATISLIPAFINPETLSDEEIVFLKSFLNSNDERTRANVLESLGMINLATEEAQKLIKSPVRRTKVNSAVILAKSNFNKEVQILIWDLLKSEHEADVSAGLYAVEKVFEHFTHENLVAMQNMSFFRDVYKLISTLINSESDLVGKKALAIFNRYKDFFQLPMNQI